MPRGRRYSLRAARMRHTLGGRPPRPDRRRRPDGQTMQLYYPGARLVRFDKPAGVGYTACDYKRDSGQRVPAGAYCGGRPRGRSAADRRHPMNADGAGGVAYGVVLGWPMAWFWVDAGARPADLRTERSDRRGTDGRTPAARIESSGEVVQRRPHG